MKAKRLTLDDLEAMSAASGVPFERDPETDTAHLRVGRDDFYAELPREAVQR